MAFKEGDQVEVTVQEEMRRTWSKNPDYPPFTLPVGFVLTVEKVDQGGIYFRRGERLLRMPNTSVRLVESTTHRCTCALTVLMASGCQCGGT